MELPDLMMFIDEKFTKMEKLCKSDLQLNGASFNYEFIDPVKDKLNNFRNGELSYYGIEGFKDYLDLLDNESLNTDSQYNNLTILSEIKKLKTKINIYRNPKDISEYF